MARVEFGWNEDLDLNAAVGALAPLLGQDQIRKRSGDQLIPQEDILLHRIRAMDEAGGGAGGYLTIEGVPRNIYFGKYVGDNIQELNFPGPGLKIPAKTALDCVGNQSGAGAEQHSVILTATIPSISEPKHASLSSIKEHFIFGVKSGTIVAATFGAGSQDILTNLEDSEEKLSISKDIRYVLIGIINAPLAAGYGICGFRMADLKVDRVFPGKQLVGQAQYFPIDDINPTPQFGYLFTGDESPVAMAAGVGVTSVEMGFHIGLL